MIEREIRRAAVSDPERPDRVSFCFPPDFVGFQGHYPGRPILPAFVQVMAALEAGSRVLGRKLVLAEIASAKFTRPVGPDETVCAACGLRESDGLILAEIAMAVGDEAVSVLKLKAKERGT